MIIKYPTGLYNDQLNEYVYSTNVTYNISNNATQRSNIIFVQVPIAERLRPLPALEYNRDVLGDLIFTISDSTASNAQLSKRMLEIGSILEFNAPTDIVDIADVATSSAEVTHNLNYLDYSSLGFSATDIDNINKAVNQSFNDKTILLNGLKQQYAVTYNDIQNIQRKINEINSAISALQLANSGSLDSYIEKLEADLTIYNNSLVEQNDLLNGLSAQISSETDSLRALGALVK